MIDTPTGQLCYFEDSEVIRRARTCPRHSTRHGSPSTTGAAVRQLLHSFLLPCYHAALRCHPSRYNLPTFRAESADTRRAVLQSVQWGSHVASGSDGAPKRRNCGDEVVRFAKRNPVWLSCRRRALPEIVWHYIILANHQSVSFSPLRNASTYPQSRSATREVSSALKLADTRFTCFQHNLRVRLVKAARHGHSKESLHRHKHHNSQRPESHTASDRTALLESSGMPLIGTMLLLYFDVIFPVSRLKPENWMVAPSTLSMSDPARPAASPAAWCITLQHSVK